MPMLDVVLPQAANHGCADASVAQKHVGKLRSSTPPPQPPPPHGAEEPSNGSPFTPATPIPGSEVEQPRPISVSALSSKRCKQCRTCLRPALKQACELRKAEREALGIAKSTRRPGIPRDPEDHRPRKKSKAGSRAYDQGTSMPHARFAVASQQSD